MSTQLITEVKQQWATLVLGMVTVCVLGQVWNVSDTEFVLWPDFHKFWCTIPVSAGFAAGTCRSEVFSTSFILANGNSVLFSVAIVSNTGHSKKSLN